jgi:hypothetical protein
LFSFISKPETARTFLWKKRSSKREWKIIFKIIHATFKPSTKPSHEFLSKKRRKQKLKLMIYGADFLEFKLKSFEDDENFSFPRLFPSSLFHFLKVTDCD